MRVRNLLATFAVMFAVVQLPTGMAQRSGFGGGPPGGFSGGGMFSDPSAIFQKLANDRSYFLISETRMLREPLMEWAKKNGITDDKITREHFDSAWPVISEQMKSRFGGGGSRPPGSPGSPGPSGSSAPSSTSSSSSSTPSSSSSSGGGDTKQFAESEFKRRDDNNDGKLNRDEMSSSLRDGLSRWDTNNDGLIDFNEYLPYITSRTQRDQAITVIIEDDLERRPVVYRAGKLPKELPSWFQELDIDTDGQVSLYEWRKPRRDVDEFRKFDRNDDGFLVAEEVLRAMNIPQAASTPSPASVTTIIAGSSNTGNSGFTGSGGGFGGFRGGSQGGGPPGGFGGFGGFRGGSQGGTPPSGFGGFGGFRGGSNQGGMPTGGFSGKGGFPGGGFPGGGFRGGSK